MEIGGVGPNSGSPVETITYGPNETRGTYVCKQLVYAYAMWISAKFHLQVINVFDQYVSNPVPAFQLPQTMGQALALDALSFDVMSLP